MKDKSLKTILDRDLLRVQVKTDFQQQIDLMEEVVDYGTNLIPRAFSSSDKKIKDIVIIPVLLKQVVAMLDAIQILVSEGAILAAHVPARSLFEAFLYVNWILDKNTEKRAKQYYVWDLRRKQQWNNRVITGTAENKKFLKTISKRYPNLKQTFTSLEKKAKSQNSEIDNLLKSKKFRSINQAFNKLETMKTSVQWFNPNGPSSISDLASRLNRKAEYDILYNSYSKITHSNVLSEQVSFKKQTVTFEPIRDLKRINSLLITTLSLTFDVYSKILSEYRKEEKKQFSTKYVQEWRKRFRNIKKVSYN